MLTARIPCRRSIGEGCWDVHILLSSIRRVWFTLVGQIGSPSLGASFFYLLTKSWMPYRGFQQNTSCLCRVCHSTKMREIVDYSKKYSEENVSVDLSLRIEPWPFNLRKEEYHDFLLNRTELFAVSGDPLGPHIGCVDGISERNEAVVKHIYHPVQAQVGPLDNDSFGKSLVAVTPSLLQQAKKAGKDSWRIPDIDTSEFYKPTVCTKLEFPEPIAKDICENSGMVLNRTKNLLIPVGCPFKGLEDALTAVLKINCSSWGLSRDTSWKVETASNRGDDVMWREIG